MRDERQPAGVEALPAVPLPGLEAIYEATVRQDDASAESDAQDWGLRAQLLDGIDRLQSPQAIRNLWLGIGSITTLACGSLFVHESAEPVQAATITEIAAGADMQLPLNEPIETVVTLQLPPVLPPMPECQYPVRTTQECLLPVRPHEIPSMQRLEPADQAEADLINEILAQVTPTPEEYQNFRIDTSRSRVLDRILPHETIWPELYVTHWVGYEPLCATIDDCLARMDAGGLSYGLFTMEDGVNYLIAPALHSRTNHALGANYASLGHSMNANSLETILRAPIMLEQMIYGGLWSAVEYGRPLERQRYPSHAEIVRHDGRHKPDFNSMLQDGLFNLMLELNHRVYVNGEGGHPSPFTP